MLKMTILHEAKLVLLICQVVFAMATECVSDGITDSIEECMIERKWKQSETQDKICKKITEIDQCTNGKLISFCKNESQTNKQYACCSTSSDWSDEGSEIENVCEYDTCGMIITCWWRISKTDKAKSSQTITVEERVECKMRISNMYKAYAISMTEANGFENKTSKRVVDPTHIVRMRRPINLTVSTDSSEVTVRWDVNEFEFLREKYNYKIRYRPSERDTPWKYINGNHDGDDMAKNTGINTDDLLPQTKYRVEVCVIPESYLFKGTQSNWSWTEFETNMSAPTSTVSFKDLVEVTKSKWKGANQFSVRLSWDHYKRRYEDGYSTRIHCGEDEKSMETIYDDGSDSAVFEKNWNQFLCLGQHCNSAGCSGNSSFPGKHDVFHMPIGHTPAKPQNVSINATHLLFNLPGNLRWKSCVAKICARKRTIKLKKQEKMVMASNDCVVKGFKVVKLENISHIKRRHAITISGSWSPCLEYLVILENKTREQNKILIIRSPPSSFVYYNAHFRRHQKFDAADASNSTHSQILVTWANTIKNSFVQRQLQYRPVGGEECTNKIGGSCKTRIFYRKVPGNARNVTITESVFGYTTYEITEWLVCKADDSENSYSNLTTPSKNVFVSTAISVPEPVQSLSFSADGNGDTLLRWKPPCHKNGPTTYEITVKHSKKVETVNQTSWEVDLTCTDESQQRISINVTSINSLGTISLRSTPTTVFSNCVHVYGESERSLLKIFLPVGLALLLSIGLLICWHQKLKIKTIVKLQVGLKAPKPSVGQNVLLHTHQEENPTASKKPEPCSPVFEKNGFQGDDSPSMITPLGDPGLESPDALLLSSLSSMNVGKVEQKKQDDCFSKSQYKKAKEGYNIIKCLNPSVGRCKSSPNEALNYLGEENIARGSSNSDAPFRSSRPMLDDVSPYEMVWGPEDENATVQEKYTIPEGSISPTTSLFAYVSDVGEFCAHSEYVTEAGLKSSPCSSHNATFTNGDDLIMNDPIRYEEKPMILHMETFLQKNFP